jgi:hypothetical protein
VFAGTAVVALSTSQFAWPNAGLVLTWLVIAALIAREHRQLVAPGSDDASTRER